MFFYPCALVQWFTYVADEPDEVMGMWVVRPDHNADGSPAIGVIHLDSVLCGAHLMPVFGDNLMPIGLRPEHSLDTDTPSILLTPEIPDFMVFSHFPLPCAFLALRYSSALRRIPTPSVPFLRCLHTFMLSRAYSTRSAHPRALWTAFKHT